MATAEKTQDQQKQFPVPDEDDYSSGEGEYDSGDDRGEEEASQQRNKRRRRRGPSQEDDEEDYSDEYDDNPSDQYDDYSDYDDDNDDDDDYVMQGKALQPYQQNNMEMQKASGSFSPAPQQKNSPAKNDGLKLRLDLNLDIEVDLKARINGDLTLSLL
ncbi:hypothetical protein N7474_006406 [Penicillium riverlandense]|uniref:uncharacterized protein n=1 Tax=Penicillium riverlandense TaxID=1903569 RepID=UPI0025472637|nr:uncharacterized protein N7474_006406 [Penicillium riverlandense]KAJ5814629.1 hypothetical protein N7474_006406 [Penicillium riverlandense]